ncbi:MAG: S-layer protein, partial [Planctomycetia bacterium]
MRARGALAMAAALTLIASARAADLSLHAGAVAGPDGIERVSLVGGDARQQLVALVRSADGGLTDATRRVRFTVEPVGVVAVDEQGTVLPLADGVATVTALLDGVSGTPRVTVEVRAMAAAPPVEFGNDVVPVLTKHGCNGGGCHGAAAGKNGFRLSLLGFEPDEDYRHIVQEARGRRVAPLLPDTSLLLEKAWGVLPHAGGARLESQERQPE